METIQSLGEYLKCTEHIRNIDFREMVFMIFVFALTLHYSQNHDSNSGEE